MRTMPLKLLLPVFLTLLLVGTAFAGGVVVSLDGDVPVVTAGTPFVVHFTIRSMHDSSLQDGFRPVVSADNAATGEHVSVIASPAGEPGRYTATLSLPSAGEWQWSILPDNQYPNEFRSAMTPIQVQPAGAVAPQAAPAASAALAPPVLWAAILLAAIGALLAVIGLRRRVEAKA